METVSIRLNISMEHREGQEGPCAEIARVLHALATQIGAGELDNWRAVHSISGEGIGEAHLQISDDAT